MQGQRYGCSLKHRRIPNDILPHHLSEDCSRGCGESVAFSYRNRVWNCFINSWALEEIVLSSLPSTPRATQKCRTRWCNCWSGADCVPFEWRTRCHWCVRWGTSGVLWAGVIAPNHWRPWTTHVESQLTSQSMAPGRQMPHVTGKFSRLRRMAGNKWCPTERLCGPGNHRCPRAIWSLSPANATIANASHCAVSAFSLVKFVC